MIQSFFGSILDGIFNTIVQFTPGGAGALGISIIFFTILAKTLLIPLAVKQQLGMIKMKKIQPDIKKIQDKYKSKKDPESQQKMGQELMALYKENGAHPLNGCLPTLIQLPLIIGIFSVLRRSSYMISKINVVYNQIANKLLEYPQIFNNYLTEINMKTTENLNFEFVRETITKFSTENWNGIISNIPQNSINTLVEQKQNFETFFGINLVESSGWMFPGILIPIVAAVTTYLSIKISSSMQSMDDEKSQNMNNNMIKFMPMVTFMITVNFPAGLGIYFIVSNIFQIVQQNLIKKYIIEESV